MSLHPQFGRRPGVSSADLIGLRADYLDSCGDLYAAGVGITREHLRRHALLIGSTGSGKSVALNHLHAKEILRGDSFAVLDMRGDQVNGVIELLASRTDPRRVAHFDLREKERPLGFDPLGGAGLAHFRALGVLDLVAAESASVGPQWSEMLRNALLILAGGGGRLTQIDELLYDPAFRKALIGRTSDPKLRPFWQRYGELAPERQAALASPVLNKLSVLFCAESLRRMFGHPHPLDLGGHLNTPGSVTLASLAVDELHSAGVLTGSLLLSAICREVFSRVDVPESRRNRIRLYVDEFENFGWGNFEQILAEGRRFGLSCVLAHQTLAQLTPKMRSLILGNVSTIIAFRTGREDAAVLSRHMTGDPKALDLAELPIGYAYVWHPLESPVLTEINAPLVRDVGRLSRRAAAFRQRLRAQVPEFMEARRGATPEPPITLPVRPENLEEWLG